MRFQITVRTTGKRIKSQDKRLHLLHLAVRWRDKSLNTPTTKPLCIGCSRGPDLSHSKDKHQRGPSTSKDALSCDQSDGHEQSWLLPEMSFVMQDDLKKQFIQNYATPSNRRLADRKPINQAQDSIPSVVRIVPSSLNHQFMFILSIRQFTDAHWATQHHSLHSKNS
ncbi:hypothetical protein BHYA_0116g00230 [Botrytis hyacinthi]|uniref:Uncharacterized protein n=1 Tax=Botrytis hyacinthi TaxID=278943 RepID=A0A4Z1GIH8_9HELO|nr:hypothetical protein BHYA_0116g00230 [Botrytis hyacinthi]